ncbi:hypothetical protein vseg_000757 [Gypsophila vaccaria]
MAEFPHFLKLIHPSHAHAHAHAHHNSPPFIFPLFLSSSSSLRRRRLSLLSPSSSASPNLLLISTSVKSDGSLVFKFGDASELPPPAVENDDCSGTVSVDAEIEVESEVESGDDLAVVDQVNSVSKVVDDVKDDITPNDSPKESLESNKIAKDDEHNRGGLVVKSSEVEDVVGVDTMNNNNNDVAAITGDGFGFDDCRLGVENLDSTSEVSLEVEDEEVDDNDSVKVSVAELDDVDEVVDMKKSPAISVFELEDADKVVDMTEAPVFSMAELEDADEAVDMTESPAVSVVELEDVDKVVDMMESPAVSVVDLEDADKVVDMMESPAVSVVDLEDADKVVDMTESPAVSVVELKDADEVVDMTESPAVTVVELEDVDKVDTMESPAVSVVELEDVDKVVDMMESPAVSVVDLEDADKVVDMMKSPAVSVVDLEDADKVVDMTESPAVSVVELKDADEVVHMTESPAVTVVELEDVDKVDTMGSPAVSVVELDDVDEVVDVMESPAVQLEANSVADEEVSDAGLPSIEGLEDSPSGDHANEAIPCFVNTAVKSIESVVDRALPKEEISSDNGGISALSSSISAAPTSLTPPLKANDAVTSANQQSDDCTESSDISESTGSDPGPGSYSLGIASGEADADSVQISTVAVSVPSASLPETVEVNDAATLSIQQSNDIYAADDPEPGISATEISLSEEILAPSLCLVSAAASLAHSLEALAGGHDAYFVFENWFGVADGVGQWSFGGINKGLYAEEFIQNCESLARNSKNTGLDSFKELFQQSAAMTESSGAARVLIAHVAEQVLHVANIGDTGFIIIRNGTLFIKSSPMFHEFNFPHAISSGDDLVEAAEEYHVELKDGDIIVTATDGLFDNLYEHDIVSLVCEAVEDGKTLKEIAELLASRSQEVGRLPDARTPFADAAQAAGHPEFSGGKFDHVTVIVSAVQKE